MNKKVVIFDLDGTLIDSLDSSAVCIQRTMSRLRRRDFTIAQIQSFFGQPEEFVFKLLSPEGADASERGETSGAALNQIASGPNRNLDDVTDLMASYLSEIRKNMQMFPLYDGAIDLLEALAKAGFRMGLCTARGNQATDVILKEHKILEHFALVVTGNDVKVQKPDTEGVKSLIKYFNATAQDVYFIGDSPSDWQVAHEVGAIGVRALWGAHPQSDLYDHFLSFKNLTALKNYLLSLID